MVDDLEAAPAINRRVARAPNVPSRELSTGAGPSKTRKRRKRVRKSAFAQSWHSLYYLNEMCAYVVVIVA